MQRARETNFAGCLLGGAVGDALGYPVEKSCYAQIVSTYGKRGIQELDAPGRIYAPITDDTQMTLFTAEGLLRDNAQRHGMGISDTTTCLRHAYARWLRTQGLVSNMHLPDSYLSCGWLMGIRELYARRAPSDACLSALMSRKLGTPQSPINESRGTAGLMRVAPVGLYAAPEEAFELGCASAALTDGHPRGYLPAGAFALLLALLRDGESLEHAIGLAQEALMQRAGHEPSSYRLSQAMMLARRGDPGPHHIESIGEGYTADEALAIGLYCALCYPEDIVKALRLAVNHSGDSDTTGTVCGNILGLLLGEDALPPRWRYGVELCDVVRQMALDVKTGYRPDEDWEQRYPGF